MISCICPSIWRLSALMMQGRAAQCLVMGAWRAEDHYFPISPSLTPRMRECRPLMCHCIGCRNLPLTPDTDIAPAPCLKTLAGIRVISSVMFSSVLRCVMHVMQADLCALACVHSAPTAQLPCVRNSAFVSSVQPLSPAPHYMWD